MRNPRKDLSAKEKAAWKYIRVRGLGFVRGMLCPHHDMVQSNGELRADDFEGMLRRNRHSVGVCVEDQAAVVIDGDSFHVVAADGKSKVLRKRVEKGGSISSVVFKPGENPRTLVELIGR